MRIVAGLGAVLLAGTAWAGDVVVLEAPSPDEGFHEAAETLAAHHGAEILKLDPARPASLLPALRKLAPRHAILVMPPDAIDFAFQRRFLDAATRVDEDPFVDFAFGYVTGADGKEAKAFAQACIDASARPREAVLAVLSGNAPKSIDSRADYHLRTTSMRPLRGRVAAAEGGHDRAFLAQFLPKLAACNLVEFAGHGFPDQVVGCLDAADLAGVRLPGAVVLNVACWNGVTGAWFDYEKRRLVRKEVAPAKSVALAVLRTGVCGYTAYLCPRPQGPELDRDLVALAVDGATLGDARRRDYDKTLLGFLGFGEERMDLAPLEEGSALPSPSDGIRDLMLPDATGGVLFGDPTVRPFAARAGEDPIEVRHERKPEGIVVDAACAKRSLWLHCDDPAGRVGGKQAMKVYSRIPLGDVLVEEVAVDRIRVGPRDVPSRVVWAVEEDHGERFVHVKVAFPRQDSRGMGEDDALALRFTVRRAASVAKARSAGGTAEAPIRGKR